jgi:hypothetical protein
MEYDLIGYLQTLIGNGIKGYVISKPEGTPYPAFVVEDTMSRGTDIYGNNGKAFDYIHSIQINLIGQRFTALRTSRDIIIERLDGFSGVLGINTIVDCRLEGSEVTKNINENFEFILTFTLSTK